MNIENIGKNIRKYHKKLNLTQEKIAESCGISVGYFRQIEQGYKTPKLVTFIKIAEALDAPLYGLLSDSSEDEYVVDVYGINKKLEKLPEQERMEALSMLDYHIQLLKKRITMQNEKEENE